jgi:hypothetical protein
MVQVLYLYTIFGMRGATIIPNTRMMDKKADSWSTVAQYNRKHENKWAG